MDKKIILSMNNIQDVLTTLLTAGIDQTLTLHIQDSEENDDTDKIINVNIHEQSFAPLSNFMQIINSLGLEMDIDTYEKFRIEFTRVYCNKCINDSMRKVYDSNEINKLLEVNSIPYRIVTKYDNIKHTLKHQVIKGNCTDEDVNWSNSGMIILHNFCEGYASAYVKMKEDELKLFIKQYAMIYQSLIDPDFKFSCRNKRTTDPGDKANKLLTETDSKFRVSSLEIISSVRMYQLNRIKR